MKSADLQVTRFKGLNTLDDPLRLGLSWLTRAENINITSAGKIEPREGYSLDTAGTMGGAYGTLDHERMYYVAGTSIKAKDGPTLSTGLSTAPMYWSEVNEQVFYNNGVDSGIILGDHSRIDWSWTVPGTPSLRAITGSLPAGKYDVCCTYVMADGRETGNGDAASIDLDGTQALQISGIPQVAGLTTRVYLAPANSTVFQLLSSGAPAAIVWNLSPDALGTELRTDACDPLPAGATVIQHWRGRMYAAQYFPGEDMTAIWFSQPLGFHLFDLSVDFLAVPNKVLALAPTNEALIVGTDKKVYSFDGEKLDTLASYGVVPGWCWATDDEREGQVLIWTQRGLCRAMPFENLTSGHVSVAPGIQAGAAVIASGGQKRFIATLHAGGSAFNQR